MKQWRRCSSPNWRLKGSDGTCLGELKHRSNDERVESLYLKYCWRPVDLDDKAGCSQQGNTNYKRLGNISPVPCSIMHSGDAVAVHGAVVGQYAAW